MTLPRCLPALASGAGLVAGLLLPAAAAGGGERPDAYAGAQWQDGQKAAVGSALVALVKVVEAGKPEGEGWNGNMNRVGNHTDWTSDVDIKQEAVLEVSEVLRGARPAGRLKVRLGKFEMRYRALQTYWSRHLRKRNQAFAGMSAPVETFSLKKDRSYLLFLKAPEGEGVVGLAAAPVPASEASVVKSVRAFCKVLAVWEKPPALSAEEEKKVRAMIGQLGDADYKKRADADGALRAMGHLLRPYLAAAAEDDDLEKATAAERIIRDFAPQPGKNVAPRLPDQVLRRLAPEKPDKPEKPPEGPPEKPVEKSAKEPAKGAPAPAR
ncbi:MAG: hypothetical protein ACYTGB_10585 [Planctomycetota bacterium]